LVVTEKGVRICVSSCQSSDKHNGSEAFGFSDTVYVAVTKEKKMTLDVNRIIRVPVLFLSYEDEYFSSSSSSSLCVLTAVANPVGQYTVDLENAVSRVLHVLYRLRFVLFRDMQLGCTIVKTPTHF